ncbi:MAG: hypothetical protein WBP81_24525 [Solirubrobacteraceae bacterium]
MDARHLSSTGIALLLAGVVLVTTATWIPTLVGFLAGGALSGAGAGLLVKGGIDTVLELAPREARAETLAGFFLAAYLGLSGPTVGLGLATQYVSERVSLLGFVGVLVLALVAMASTLVGSPDRRGRPRRDPEITYQGARS